VSPEFEIVFEGDFPGTPEQVWNPVTVETAAWLFPTQDMVGEELIVEPPTHHLNRLEGPDGWFNQLEQVISPRIEGGSHLRWVHSGVFTDDWDAQYDGASKHTAFYMHTLAQYLEHFVGRAIVFADIPGPDASAAAEAFETVRAALGITAQTGAGASIDTSLPGAPKGAIVDLQDTLFVGLRTSDSLIRFFGRNAYGAPVGITVHHFGTADALELQRSWKDWLDDLFA
jgi:hypothetical protein